jgi:uncharacterized protein YbjQ (UPF0145 family)
MLCEKCKKKLATVYITKVINEQKSEQMLCFDCAKEEHAFTAGLAGPVSVGSLLKGLFGGRLNSFESMLDRGRREAILRMKEEARRMGAKAIFNVRLETSTLSSSSNGAGRSKKGLACVELVAYGTAWRAPDVRSSHAA